MDDYFEIGDYTTPVLAWLDSLQTPNQGPILVEVMSLVVAHAAK